MWFPFRGLNHSMRSCWFDSLKVCMDHLFMVASVTQQISLQVLESNSLSASSLHLLKSLASRLLSKCLSGYSLWPATPSWGISLWPPCVHISLSKDTCPSPSMGTLPGPLLVPTAAAFSTSSAVFSSPPLLNKRHPGAACSVYWSYKKGTLLCQKAPLTLLSPLSSGKECLPCNLRHLSDKSLFQILNSTDTYPSAFVLRPFLELHLTSLKELPRVSQLL